MTMLQSHSEVVSMDAVSSSIIRTLLYFDVFDYPLTLSEIARFCQNQKTDYESIRETVSQLIRDGVVFKLHHFYSLQNKPALADQRKDGNERAKKYIRIARKFSRLIAVFPFVRGIYLSGSLSKGYADKNADIDYFVITEPNRLWLCRTILMLFKKVFLLNSKKFFCINYFIDTNHLEIPDRNIFTATEIATVIPTYNAKLYADFIQANRWKNSFYPNFRPVYSLEEKKISHSFLKTVAEKMLSGKLGNRLDRFCFTLTSNTWNKRFSKMNNVEFEHNLRSRSYVSKHHPNGMQFRILKMFQEKLNNFENIYNLKLY